MACDRSIASSETKAVESYVSPVSLQLKRPQQRIHQEADPCRSKSNSSASTRPPAKPRLRRKKRNGKPNTTNSKVSCPPKLPLPSSDPPLFRHSRSRLAPTRPKPSLPRTSSKRPSRKSRAPRSSRGTCRICARPLRRCQRISARRRDCKRILLGRRRCCRQVAV